MVICERKAASTIYAVERILMMRRNIKYDLIRFYGQQSNQFLRLGPVFRSQASINLETGSPTQKDLNNVKNGFVTESLIVWNDSEYIVQKK